MNFILKFLLEYFSHSFQYKSSKRLYTKIRFPKSIVTVCNFALDQNAHKETHNLYEKGEFCIHLKVKKLKKNSF